MILRAAPASPAQALLVPFSQTLYLPEPTRRRGRGGCRTGRPNTRPEHPVGRPGQPGDTSPSAPCPWRYPPETRRPRCLSPQRVERRHVARCSCTRTRLRRHQRPGPRAPLTRTARGGSSSTRGCLTTNPWTTSVRRAGAGEQASRTSSAPSQRSEAAGSRGPGYRAPRRRWRTGDRAREASTKGGVRERSESLVARFAVRRRCGRTLRPEGGVAGSERGLQERRSTCILGTGRVSEPWNAEIARPMGHEAAPCARAR